MARPIDEKFLDSRDLFALKYAEGLVFFEVNMWEETQFAPFENLEDIESSTNLDSGFQRLNEGITGDNNDVLLVPKGDHPDTVLHVGIGQSPSLIRRYTYYPENESRLGQVPNLQAPRPGNNYGYVDGRDSSYHEPTDAGELFIPPGARVSFDFQNPDDVSHEPALSLKMRRYEVDILDPTDRSHHPAIRRIVQAGGVGPIKPVGSIDKQAGFNMGSDWDVRPMSKSEARSRVS